MSDDGTRRLFLADHIGCDWIPGGWFFYIGPLFVRWERKRGQVRP